MRVISHQSNLNVKSEYVKFSSYKEVFDKTVRYKLLILENHFAKKIVNKYSIPNVTFRKSILIVLFLVKLFVIVYFTTSDKILVTKLIIYYTQNLTRSVGLINHVHTEKSSQIGK